MNKSLIILSMGLSASILISKNVQPVSGATSRVQSDYNLCYFFRFGGFEEIKNAFQAKLNSINANERTAFILAKDNAGMTLLDHAIVNKNDETCVQAVELVFSSDSLETAYNLILSINNAGIKAWHCSIRRGIEAIVKNYMSIIQRQAGPEALWNLMIEKSGGPRWTPLHSAVAFKNKAIVFLLLQTAGSRAAELIRIKDAGGQDSLAWAKIHYDGQIMAMLKQASNQQ